MGKKNTVRVVADKRGGEATVTILDVGTGRTVNRRMVKTANLQTDLDRTRHCYARTGARVEVVERGQ